MKLAHLEACIRDWKLPNTPEESGITSALMAAARTDVEDALAEAEHRGRRALAQLAKVRPVVLPTRAELIDMLDDVLIGLPNSRRVADAVLSILAKCEPLDETDFDFLRWLYDRLVEVHGENPHFDYMHRLAKIAKRAQPAPPQEPPASDTPALDALLADYPKWAPSSEAPKRIRAAYASDTRALRERLAEQQKRGDTLQAALNSSRDNELRERLAKEANAQAARELARLREMWSKDFGRGWSAWTCGDEFCAIMRGKDVAK